MPKVDKPGGYMTMMTLVRLFHQIVQFVVLRAILLSRLFHSTGLNTARYM